jgi:hypothetical protein
MGLFSGPNPVVVFDQDDAQVGATKSVAYRKACGGFFFDTLPVFWFLNSEVSRTLGSLFLTPWWYMRANERLEVKKLIARGMGGKVVE